MVPTEANSALGYVITKEKAAFQSQNDIHIIEAELYTCPIHFLMTEVIMFSLLP